MKFKKLKEKIKKVSRKRKKGKQINPKKLEKLQQLLLDKKSDYEGRLQGDLDSEKRKSLEIKLSVVNAHISKLHDITAEQET